MKILSGVLEELEFVRTGVILKDETISPSPGRGTVSKGEKSYGALSHEPADVEKQQEGAAVGKLFADAALEGGLFSLYLSVRQLRIKVFTPAVTKDEKNGRPLIPHIVSQQRDNNVPRIRNTGALFRGHL